MPGKSLYVAIVVLVCAVGAQSSAQQVLLNDLTRLKDYRAQRESSSNEDLHRNGDARPIGPGETLVLADVEGPGVISHIWCTVGAWDPFYGRSLVLRMYWDGAEKPSVVVPLGDFFGVGHGALVDYSSAVASTSSHGRARNSYWQMPFRKRARITVSNDSKDYKVDSFYYYVDWQKHDALPENTAYFHALYRQEFPARPGDYTILETVGRGHYVGTLLSNHQMEVGWFGEGDDRFYIDGEATPSLRGTGTEDYFNDAWGFRQFSRPYYGVSLWEGYFAGDRVSAYRWHILDPIPFTESLKVTIEHKGSIFTDSVQFLGQFIERSDWVSSVAYWYQDAPIGLDDALPPAADRVAPYRVFRPKDLEIRAEPKGILQKGNDGVTYLPGKADAFIEFDFEVEESGRYLIDAFMTYAFLGAVYQPYLDGEAIGPPRDFAMEGSDLVWTRFDQHDLDGGKHTLRFEGRGASPKRRLQAPESFALSLNYLMLLRLQDMEGYRGAMNRTLEERKKK